MRGAVAVVAVVLAACATNPTSTVPAAPIAAHGSGGTNAPSQRAKPYVILVSFDGFRADYLDRFPAPNFQRLARRGVRSHGMIPAFPSKTFPNHYTIVTGLYPEHHGLVANSFYDPARHDNYAIGKKGAVQDGTWYRGEPIWVTAERQGMVTASFFWPGTEAAIEGVRPTRAKVYDVKVPNRNRVDSVLAWLRLPDAERPHMLTLYMSDLDNAGHDYGPATPEVGAAIARVDSALGRLVDGVDAMPIHDQVYFVLVADHGMAPYTRAQWTSLEDLIDTTGVRIADGGPNATLHVAGGMGQARAIRDSINRRLTHGRAYLREETPARLHYRADPRIGDVVVIMEESYQAGAREHAPKHDGGTHGWDPELPAMHALFLAAGPGVRRGVMIPAFRNVDVYPWMVEVLGLVGAPKVDGTPGHLRTLVTEIRHASPSAMSPRSRREMEHVPQ